MPALRRNCSRQTKATGFQPRGMALLLGVCTDKPSVPGLSRSGRSRVLSGRLGDSIVVMRGWCEGGCWGKVG